MHEIFKIWESLKSSLISFFSVDLFTVALKIFAVIVIALLISSVTKIFLQRLNTRLEKTNNFWDDILIKSLLGPIITFIIILGISIILDVSNILELQKEVNIIPLIRNVGTLICIVWFCLSCINLSEKRYLGRRKSRSEKVNYTSVDLATKLIKVSIFLIAVLILMDMFGVDIRGILTLAGVGGLAVVFGGKDLLASFSGTIVIYTDKPFVIGDWIRFPDKTEGHVEKISWRITKIRTFERVPLYIPNSTFANVAIENHSRMSHRRIKELIGIRYQDIDKLEKIALEISDMLKDHTDIDNKQTLVVNFDNFGESSVNFLVYAFTKALQRAAYSAVKQDVMLKVARIIRKNKAEIAYPTRVIEFGNNANTEANQRFKKV
jgi:MscS family membrane protein